MSMKGACMAHSLRLWDGGRAGVEVALFLRPLNFLGFISPEEASTIALPCSVTPAKEISTRHFILSPVNHVLRQRR